MEKNKEYKTRLLPVALATQPLFTFRYSLFTPNVSWALAKEVILDALTGPVSID